MVAPDTNHIPASSAATTYPVIKKAEIHSFRIERCSSAPRDTCNDVEGGLFAMDDLERGEEETVGHNEHLEIKKDVVSKAEVEKVVLVESSVIKKDCLESHIYIEENLSTNQKEDIVGDKLLGVKRPRTDHAPSICIRYSFLPRSSKRKLEEALHDWSNWHAMNWSSAEEPVEALESGEEMHFPALHVGSDKKSTVSYWVDNEVCKRQRNDDSAPLYDRGFAFGLTSDEGPIDEKRIVPDLREAGRCFNCGSYSHSLFKCPKPRDAAAVNNARRKFQSKRGTAGVGTPKRYYQSAADGKYDGLKPGTLAAETRELLGIGEFDPPPWLNRMRELGYPPGYLEHEDQSSGIAIFDDAAGHGGNNPKTEVLKSKMKQIVEFPGINAPVPPNANPKVWELPRCPPPRNDLPRGLSVNKPNYADPWSLRNIAGPPSPYFGSGSSPATPNHPYNFRGYDPPYSSGPFSPTGRPMPSPDYGRYPPPEPMRPLFHEGSPAGIPIPRPNYGRFPPEPMRPFLHHEGSPRYPSEPMRPFLHHEGSPVDPFFPNELLSPVSYDRSFSGWSMH